MPAFSPRTIALFSASAALSLGALAAPPSLSFLNDTVAIHIPAKDLPAFKAAVASTLNTSPAGSAVEWSSSARRGRQPVKVLLKPGQAVQTQAAGTCRPLAADVSRRGAAEQWSFWFCQQADGSWKISGH